MHCTFIRENVRKKGTANHDASTKYVSFRRYEQKIANFHYHTRNLHSLQWHNIMHICLVSMKTAGGISLKIGIRLFGQWGLNVK